MIRTITIDLTATANAETTENILSGIQGRRRVVRRVFWEQNGGLDVRAYVNQDRIVDAASECAAFDYMPVEVGMELQHGETLRVGFLNSTGGNITAKITVEYEETRS